MKALDTYLMEQIILENGFEAYAVKLGEADLTPKRLENLGKINVFVGANNSGKSRLIRGIAKTQNNSFEPRKHLRPEGIPVRELDQLCTFFEKELTQIDTGQQVNHQNILPHLRKCFADIKCSGLIQNSNSGTSPLNKIQEKINNLLSNSHYYIGSPTSGHIIRTWLEGCVQQINLLLFHQSQSLSSIYIPTLGCVLKLASEG